MKLLLTLLAAGGIVTPLLAGDADPLSLAYSVPLPGVKGRFDHFAISADGTRLAVAALGNNTVEIIDLTAKKHLLSMPGQHKPCGVLFSADGKNLYASNGDDGSFKTIVITDGTIAGSLPKLDDADNVRRDADQFYIGYGGGALAVVNVADGKLSHSIPLPAHPESFQLETNGPRLFVNVPGAQQVAVVDREKKAVTATWKLDKWHSNFPMALDEPNHRLFIGCRQPAVVVVLDTTDGHELAHTEISGDTDDLFYDAKGQALYVSCGAGFLDTLAVKADSNLQRTGHQPTRTGARTAYFSAALDTFWVAVPQGGGKDAELRAFRPAPHP